MTTEPAAPSPPTRSSPLDRALDFLLLRDSVRTVESVAEDVRTPLRRDLALARRKRLAATALLHSDPGVDAERLATEALDAAGSAVARLEGILPSDTRARLDALVETARHPSEEVPFDAHDGLATTRAMQIGRLLEAEALVHEAIEPFARTHAEITRQRINRFSGLLAVIALVSVTPWLASRPAGKVTAEASASYGGEFRPQNVLDGDLKTEWLLPNGQLGSLDLTVTPPRRLNKIYILNAHNAQYMDRATRDLKIVATCEGKATEKQLALPEISEKPTWVSIDLGTTGKCSRVRLDVLSFQRIGAGIAEVELD